MKMIVKFFLITGGVALVAAANASLTLTGTSYSQSFDNIENEMPVGWSVNSGATATSVGTAESFGQEKRSWADTAGGFKNLASADGLASSANSTQQGNSSDRALGIRQIQGVGDPGAAFVLKINNTLGLQNFSLSLNLQMLSVQSRSTTWTIDYRIGDFDKFVTLGSFSDPATFGSTSFSTADLGSWSNQNSDIWFRVVALTSSSGSGSRDTFAIDDFSLNYSRISSVPESSTWYSGIGLSLGLIGTFVRKLRK